MTSMTDQKPSAACRQPVAVSEANLVFGGRMSELLPPIADIPGEFRRGDNEFFRVVSRWFHDGLPNGTEFIPKAGIDASKALRHVQAILCSFQPKHEHKIAGVAYLLSLWFERVDIPESA